MAYRIEVALQDFNTYVQEKFSDLKDTIVCLRARIGRYAETKQTKKHGYLVKRAVDSIDDCFEGMTEPLYGVRTKITFEKACGSFGIPCNSGSDAASGWAVNPIPTMWVDYADYITASPPRFENLTASLNGEYRNRFQKRQTGEKFKSDAPADCRTINRCNT